MTGVAPAPPGGPAQHLKAGKLVEQIVHPPRLESGAVAAFVPTAVGRAAVQRGVYKVGRKQGAQAPVLVPAIHHQRTRGQDERVPEHGVLDGACVIALHQLLHQLAWHRALVPAGVDQTGGSGTVTRPADELIVGVRAGREGGVGRHVCGALL